MVVVLSSLVIGASATAGPNDKPADKKPATTTAAAKPKDATAPAAPAAQPAAGAAPTTAAPSPDVASVKPEDMPTPVRMRRLEQKTQALKERAWQLKARVQMLKEQMLGGGAGAQAVIAHANEMGASFRLIKLIYSLDGTQVFSRTDDTAENLYKTKGFDVFAGPISPGNHTLSSVATYRGHGYGVFEYLSKYTFTARGNQAFVAGEGKISRVDCRGFEKGGPTTPLEKRASIECTVTQVQPEKPAETPASGAAPATATYRGHGYGVFEYLSKYTFTAHSNQAFIAGEGKIAKVDCKGFEKGGPTTPLEKRAAIECKVTQVQPEKAPESTAPKPGPAPSSVTQPVPPGPAAATPPPAPPGK
jgi:hypothetical protein